jgi:hypothetical protein
VAGRVDEVSVLHSDGRVPCLDEYSHVGFRNARASTSRRPFCISYASNRPAAA